MINIKSIYNKCINLLATQLILIVTKLANILKLSETDDEKFNNLLEDYILKIKNDPLKPDLHSELANIYASNKNWFFAIAEYRTNMALGNTSDSLFLSLALAYLEIKKNELAQSISKKIPKPINKELKQKYNDFIKKYKSTIPQPLNQFNHNRYYRMKTLSDKLNSLFDYSNFSILDVGGGDGAFSLFVPDAKYVLAEPNINGILGTELPFEKNSFDVVIACHVLEHIQQRKRIQFLKQLCLIAKKYVLLLNPFYLPDTYVNERLKLVIKLTNTDWAKEHLDLTLPKLDDIKDFAEKNNYKYHISPNGSLTTSLAFVFLDHFASLSRKTDSLSEINNFYNTHLFNKLTNPELPTAYLVEIST